MDLWSLLEPLTQDEFRATYWQRAPLHRPAPTSSDRPPLLMLADIDAVLHRASANATEFDFYAAGSALPQSHWAGLGNFVHLNRLLGLYAKGGTIHVSNIQKYSDRLGAFCKTVQQQFQVDCEADLWMTKHNAFTPYLHYDRYDIFAVQIHGAKRWRLFDRLPQAEGHKSAALDWNDVGDPVVDVIVEPGDLIYIPPHTPHVVTTVGAHSVHLGIGLHPPTWRRVLECALELSKARPQALDEVVPLDFMKEFRGSPRDAIGEAVRRAALAIDGIDGERFSHAMFDSFLDNVTHTNDGHFAREILADSEPVGARTQVVRREGMSGRAGVEADRAFIRYAGGGEITGPSTYARAFETLLAYRGPFSALDLDPSLTLEARIELAQRAIDAGLCRRCP